MSEFYDLSKILEQKALLNIIYGKRGKGKTYSWKKLALAQFKEFEVYRGEFPKHCQFNEKKFIYLRRRKEEIKLTAKKLFTDIINDYNLKHDKKYLIDCKAGEFRLLEYNDEIGKYVLLKIIGYSIALFSAESYKTASFDDVNLLVFEEFLSKKAYSYLANEVDDFIDLISTVFRHRKKCICIMCANMSSDVNPYFEAWKIPVEDGVNTYTYKGFTIATEYTKDNVSKENVESDDFVNLASDKYINYNLANDTLDDKDLCVFQKMPKMIKPLISINNMFLYTDGNFVYVSAIERFIYEKINVRVNNGYIIEKVLKRYKPKMLSFTTNRTNNGKFFLQEKYKQKLRFLYASNKILFDNYKTRIYFEKMIDAYI